MAVTNVPEPTLQSAVEHTLMPSVVTEMQDELKGSVRCVVVTPEKAWLDKTAEMVILPLFDGEMGVLPGRAPLIARLGAGELRIKKGDAIDRLFVEEGFVQVRANVVTVLTAKAMKATDVTRAAAEQARTEAEALPSGNAVERAECVRGRFMLRHGRFRCQGFAPNACGIHMNEGIQFRIQAIDLREMSLDEFDRRDLSIADLFCHDDSREKSQFAHEVLACLAQSSIFFSSEVSGR